MDDLCLSKDTRKWFSSFDFSPDDALTLWAVVEKFHRNAENLFTFLWFIARKFKTKKVW